MNYEERKKTKIDRYRELARKYDKSSSEFFSKGFCERTGIPMGQPILVGHHSERRHRNAIARYENQARKACEEYDKAKYYAERAKSAENNLAISSDDDDATTKLKEKVAALEKQREKIKQLNKERRAKGEDGSPSWVLSNLGQNIRSVKERIKHIEKTRQIEEVEETYGEITLKVDQDANRVKLFFPGKPENEVRTKLKRNGFRWSPYNGCWQAYLKEWNIRTAREIATEVSV